MNKFSQRFPLWISLACATAILWPPVFTWFQGPWITWGLAVIMLGMGLTLSFDDFRRVFKFPKWFALGIALQFTLMPLLGWSIARLFELPTAYAVGLILVSCCPGGTASNVIVFLARANVALSVTMTAVSTSLAILLTPTLTSALVGARTEVDAMGLLFSTVRVVLAPILIGLLLKQFLPKATKRILPIAPPVAVIAIVMIVASIVGASKDQILSAGPTLPLAVLTLHVAGFVLGYLLSMLFLKNKKVARTISIEVGMQNSGLGAVLARENFANPLTPIPSALSALTHALLGSLLAGLWQRSKKARK